MKKIIALLKKHKDIIIAASIAIILFLTALWCTVIFPFSQIAHADYETDIIQNQNAIINFNQLIAPSYNTPFTFSNGIITGTVIANTTYSIANIGRLSGGHLYYLNFDSGEGFTSIQITNNMNYSLTSNISNVSDRYTNIFTCSHNTNYLQYDFYLSTLTAETNFNIRIYFIDLTQMFGEGNEPNIEQANKLFVADYYSYTAGTPVSFNTTDAYVNGMNAFIQSTKFTINTYDFINSAYGVTLTNEYAGVIEKDYNAGYLTLMPAPTDTSSQTPTCCIPFRMALPQGTQVTISGKCYSSVYSGASPVYVGFWDGSQMYEVQEQFRVGSGSGGQGYRFIETTVTVTLPFEASQMYIYYGYDSGTMYLKDFSVGYYVTDLDILKAASYQGGYDDAETYYKNYYSYGWSGYQDIFNAGVRSTQENGAVFQDTWSFVGTAFSGIGNMLSVELFPNVPLGVFVAFPLLLGLIFFIVKLTKGGS